MATATQIKSSLAVIRAVADTIKAAGEVPSGVIYAALMEHGISLHGHQAIEDMLVNAGIVCRNGDLLVWNNPEGGK